MRLEILVLAVTLAVAGPAAGGCCSLGGASYDYLGDSAMDIGMESYEEFLRDDVAQSSLAAVPDSDREAGAAWRLGLNLSDSSSITLLISSTGEDIAGRGNLTRNNETIALQAEGVMQQSRLLLNATASGGSIYRFDLKEEGSSAGTSILGNYSLVWPDGKEVNGTAEGWWVAA